MRKVKSWMRSERGQNTVEYLLMLAVIVGLVLIVGKIFKPQVSTIFGSVMQNISGAASSMSSGN